MKKIVCIPVFNEKHRLKILINNLLKSGLQKNNIIFVNDGSTDGSEKFIESQKFQIINYQKNIGIGHSIIRAIEYAIEQKAEVIAIMSSNGKMMPNELNKFFDKIPNYDFINGSRYINKNIPISTPVFRRYSIYIISNIISMFTNKKITDFSCGYRCFKLSILKDLNIDLNNKKLFRYRFESELYSKVILSNKIKFLEIGINMNYPIDKKNYSKIRPFIDWIDILLPIFINIIKHIFKFNGK